MHEANHARRPSTGFTLIELLVVVAIIALLIAILMPSLNAAKVQAKTTVCMSHLHQFAIAFSLYGHDSKLHPPLNGTQGTSERQFRDGDLWYYPHVVARYIPGAKLSQMRSSLLGVFSCPAEAADGRAYAMNYFTSSPPPPIIETCDCPDPPVLPPPPPPKPSNYCGPVGGARFNPYTVKRPNRYFLLGEETPIYNEGEGLYGTRSTIGERVMPYYNFRVRLDRGDRGPFRGYIDFQRHSSRSSFLLSDMAVRSLAVGQVVDDPRKRSKLTVWWSPEDRQLNPR